MLRALLPELQSRIAVVSIGVFLCLVIVVGITALTTSGAPPSARVSNSLSNPNHPYATDAHLEPTTAFNVHRDATARVAAATRAVSNPPTKDQYTPTPVPISDNPGNRIGIIVGPLPPPDDFPFRNDAIIENFSRAFPHDSMFIVAAGAANNDPQQGFVGVATSGRTGLYALNKSLTPTKHGSVHITAVNGSLVTLMAQDGTTFTFDDTTYMFK
jgi:hypothetical protein